MVVVVETLPYLDDVVADDRSNIVDVCSKLLVGWDAMGASEAELEMISGGITNTLVKVSPVRSTGMKPVMVRLFGANTELLVDRAREAKVLAQLNAAGFGAQVLGAFRNGRIEKFLDCYTLEPRDMSKPILMRRTAQLLHKFHRVQIDEEKKPMLFVVVRRMLEMARELHFECSKKAAFEAIDFAALTAEINEMEIICTSSGSPVVYSHNDLLSGNILLMKESATDTINEESSPINFIDFEYGSYSFRGFDFGNHFNEFAGFDCDWSLYPSPELQRQFALAYLEADPSTSHSRMGAMLDTLVAEADLFSLMSHIYWGVWAIIQAKYSSIDFDYLEYSKNRIDQYFLRKPGILKAARENAIMK